MFEDKVWTESLLHVVLYCGVPHGSQPDPLLFYLTLLPKYDALFGGKQTNPKSNKFVDVVYFLVTLKAKHLVPEQRPTDALLTSCTNV